ncbi:DNA-dependent RNA polymerase auxiliary subunit epsilon family protein [Salicibibacter cibarius]|uniref:DNA-directed RNA polymerase subunit epsilon n=1 Tax=Salicibibacter cibarius TaxID=2743000 RepID=A0A7T7CCD1_9BACI|nr:DNA-directed RNA polymerase subunit epsilon [Salicibibacter cibarius]QQK76790.1 DNA-dependent RNA polymerase auxiliary subunit epsilon family protein [Salicibibacter cibarius]
MIFKVLYQQNYDEMPVREKTETLFIEGDSKQDVRKKLAEDHINIELVQPLSDAHLEYEQKSEDFKVEKR